MSLTYTDKRMNVLSALAKIESVYGTDPTPDPATDGILLQLDGSTPNFMPDAYEYSGDNGPNSVGLEANPYSPPSGRSNSMSIPMYVRGYGAAYTSGHVPPNGLHALLKACGFTATLDASSGSEKFTYSVTPDSTTPASLTIYASGRQVRGAGNLVLQKALGCLGSFKIAATDAKPPLATFEFKGFSAGDPAEASFTLPTLVNSPIIPNSAGTTFTVDGTALDIYSWAYDQARELTSARTPLTATGVHNGFVAGPHKPMLKVTIEDKLFATFKGYTKLGSKATAAIVLGWNQATQYNRIKCLAPTAQIVNVTPSGKGRIGLMDLDILFTPTTPDSYDSHTWVMD